jgi:hypothetical protein
MASKPTVDYEAYVSTVREKNKRIAALEAQLAQTKSGRDSCIADLRKATEIFKETEDQMAEAKRARESFAGMWRRSCLEINELEELLEKSERELAEARKLAQWTPKVTIQGWYWHWDGNKDNAAHIYHVMCSRSGALDRFFLDYPDSRWCEDVGGWWMPIERPTVPPQEDK